MRRALIALMLPFAAATAALATPQQGRSVGDTDVLATIPATPGSPEGVAMNGHKVYVSAAARFGTAGNNLPSTIYVFDVRDGASLGSIAIVGEDLSQEHALSGMAFDSGGVLYVLSTQIGVIRIDPAHPAQQTVYATPLPDLPECGHQPPLPPNTPCTPTPVDGPPLPNDI